MYSVYENDGLPSTWRRRAHLIDRAKLQRAARAHAGQRPHLHHQLADYAQRAFGADVQVVEVVAGGGLAHHLPRAKHLPLRRHHQHRHHVLACRAVFQRGHPAAACGGHAADGRVAGRVGPEEQAVRAQEVVQRRFLHTRAHGAHHVVLVQAQCLQGRRAEHDAAAVGHAAALHARPCAARRHWHAMPGAGVHASSHLLHSLGRHYCQRRRGIVEALVDGGLLQRGGVGANRIRPPPACSA
mmetsp:Transcript_30978/g.79534  ORF Transcript_30978/g.79534 Transcript_30978/m.79534 type:complete len:241 (-) Transcript_30978:80-802(-)